MVNAQKANCCFKFIHTCKLGELEWWKIHCSFISFSQKNKRPRVSVLIHNTLGGMQWSFNTVKLRKPSPHKLVYVVGLHAVKFGDNWMKEIPRTAKIGWGRKPSPISLLDKFFYPIIFKFDKDVVLVLINYIFSWLADPLVSVSQNNSTQSNRFQVETNILQDFKKRFILIAPTNPLRSFTWCANLVLKALKVKRPRETAISSTTEDKNNANTYFKHQNY